ncbi:uncharacterized protein F5147DRAFT_841905 [Suillus discolor]|uniref:Uncharacterized protein n=1 Tax=Suillus discolor TaxID=1912936 RepID=A0A9P7JKT9_9AGAM|nr:uncharacterized protein F5147DRAFT_841905 [Suillus discolor]KAG2084446.1 hypothetical protein F5147DRAFT_841905 [Suillus discolor]
MSNVHTQAFGLEHVSVTRWRKFGHMDSNGITGRGGGGRPHSAHRHSAGTKKNAPTPGIGIPDLPHGLEAWRAAVKQWEDPAASIGGKALKDWPEEWYTGDMRTINGVKRKIRKVITIKFYRLHGDDGVFLEKYPEANREAEPLFDAIQRGREARGEITGRTSKNGQPEVRASASR